MLYLGLIGVFIYGFDKADTYNFREGNPKTKFSIIIPFRNEAEHLEALIRSISKLNYPTSHYELLLINDDSDDHSAGVVETCKHKFKDLDISIFDNVLESNSPKKDAIVIGITKAKFDWIVTSDADCIMPEFWLDIYDNHIQYHETNFMMGPVIYKHEQGFLNRFQILDLLSLQGATIGSYGIGTPILCNGANLVYSKLFFKEVNGFEGNTSIASGDDIFLLEKAIRHEKSKVHYIKNNQITVITSAQPDFKSLVAQRVRWASKTSNYNSLFGKLTGLIVFLMNGLILCLPLFYLIELITLKSLLYTVFIKFSIDFLILYKSARFLEQEQYLISFLTSSLLYPFFCIYVAVLSVFTDYKWKGRRYSK